MGCCHARNCNTEVSYFTSGLNFIEQRGGDCPDLGSLDFVIRHYIKQNYVNTTNSQDAYEVEESSPEKSIGKLYRLDPNTFQIDPVDRVTAENIGSQILEALGNYAL